MGNLNTLAGLYIPIGLIISYSVAYLYLRRYPSPNVKYSYYFAIAIFGLVLFNMFLVPFDYACAGYVEQYLDFEFTAFDGLDIYYIVFGIIFQVIGDIVCPILIMIETSGFYTKKEIALDVLKGVFLEFFELIKIVIILLVTIPTTINLSAGGSDGKELFRITLLILDFFPYMKFLYYIGFVSQDIIYSYLRKRDEDEWRYFDTWKFGKLYKYFNRQREIVNRRYEDIKNAVIKALEHFHIELPEDFMKNYDKFKINIEKAQRNIININYEKQSLKDAYDKYKEDVLNKDIEKATKYDEESFKMMFSDIDYQENAMKNQVALDSSRMDSMSEYSEENSNYDEFEGMSDEELRQQLGSDAEIIIEKRKKKQEESNQNQNVVPVHIEEQLVVKEKKFESFDNLKTYVCRKMTKCNTVSVSIQRLSHIISRKGLLLYYGKRHRNVYSCWRFFPIIFYFLFLFYLEFPIFIYPTNGDIFLQLFFGIISCCFYLFILNYALINHKYISGELLFGNHKSSSYNFYKFISEVISFSDSVFFHSIWAISKGKKELDYEYGYKAKFLQVFELPVLYISDDLDIVTVISILIILICMFNAAKFSVIKLKIKKWKINKVLFLFNENADFFYNEANLFSNFIIGCGCLFWVQKNPQELQAQIGNEELETSCCSCCSCCKKNNENNKNK